MAEQIDQLFTKILVPVDGSKFSLQAVKLATRLARHCDSSLLLLHAFDAAVVAQLEGISDKSHDEIRADMEKNVKGFLRDMSLEVSQWDIPFEVILREGTPHEVILEEAEKWGAEIIVMGKLGKRGVSRILLGSVAERVIEFTRLPVMLATA
ncbi:universal stress protein [Desulfogranum mediterraneum]|uniref:universal stress protein n=1 Tax=Desulfogranum mediterraneum TaxID=160661 RepID=UPI000424D034|nr:universal stress protein [Desulfogranum mediterraneum]